MVDRLITDGVNTEVRFTKDLKIVNRASGLDLDIGNGLSPEKVDKFCYFGEM